MKFKSFLFAAALALCVAPRFAFAADRPGPGSGQWQTTILTSSGVVISTSSEGSVVPAGSVTGPVDILGIWLSSGPLAGQTTNYVVIVSSVSQSSACTTCGSDPYPFNPFAYNRSQWVMGPLFYTRTSSAPGVPGVGNNIDVGVGTWHPAIPYGQGYITVDSCIVLNNFLDFGNPYNYIVWRKHDY